MSALISRHTRSFSGAEGLLPAAIGAGGEWGSGAVCAARSDGPEHIPGAGAMIWVTSGVMIWVTSGECC